MTTHAGASIITDSASIASLAAEGLMQHVADHAEAADGDPECLAFLAGVAESIRALRRVQPASYGHRAVTGTGETARA